LATGVEVWMQRSTEHGENASQPCKENNKQNGEEKIAVGRSSGDIASK